MEEKKVDGREGSERRAGKESKDTAISIAVRKPAPGPPGDEPKIQKLEAEIEKLKSELRKQNPEPDLRFVGCHK